MLNKISPAIMIVTLILVIASFAAQTPLFGQSGRVRKQEVATTPAPTPVKNPPKQDLYLQLGPYQNPPDEIFSNLGSIGTVRPGIYASGPVIDSAPIDPGGLVRSTRYVKLGPYQDAPDDLFRRLGSNGTIQSGTHTSSPTFSPLPVSLTGVILSSRISRTEVISYPTHRDPFGIRHSHLVVITDAQAFGLLSNVDNAFKTDKLYSRIRDYWSIE